MVDPQKAIIQVEDYLMATSQLAQTTLRVVPDFSSTWFDNRREEANPQLRSVGVRRLAR